MQVSVSLDFDESLRESSKDLKKFVLMDPTSSIGNNSTVCLKFVVDRQIHDFEVKIKHTEDNKLKLAAWPLSIKRKDEPRGAKRYLSKDLDIHVSLVRSSVYRESDIIIEDISISGCRICLLIPAANK